MRWEGGGGGGGEGGAGIGVDGSAQVLVDSLLLALPVDKQLDILKQLQEKLLDGRNLSG